MSAWWLLCAGSVGAMLGFSFAAMLAAGKRADLENTLDVVRGDYELTRQLWSEAKAERDSLKYAFNTLCRAMKQVGIAADTADAAHPQQGA